MEWDELIWDGMGFDGMGYDGMGWVIKEKKEVRELEKKNRHLSAGQ